MKKILCFDMDGTIADLYNVPDWLKKLREDDTSPYADAAPMWDMEALCHILTMLQAKGWEVRVITWPSMGASREYKRAIAQTKREWLDKYAFPYNRFHCVQYGTTKANSVRKDLGEGTAILIDDNAKVRRGWNLGPTIDPAAVDLLAALTALID